MAKKEKEAIEEQEIDPASKKSLKVLGITKQPKFKQREE